jgi:hypothetical protein
MTMEPNQPEGAEGDWSIRPLPPRPWPWRSSARYVCPTDLVAWVICACADKYESAAADEDAEGILTSFGEYLYLLNFETIH